MSQAAAVMPAVPPERVKPAHNRLRLVAFILIVGGFAAAAWDGWWHTQYTFDGFWSPPHLLGYGVATLAALLVSDAVFNANVRQGFGRGFMIPILPYPVPGALFILTGALAVLGFGGVVLDNIWHSMFGLDETSWSLPHAMIGTALLLAVLGIVACRIQVGQRSWLNAVFYGWLVSILWMALVMGPIGVNNSPVMVEARKSIPVIAAQPDALRGVEVLLANNLDRTNPLIMVLAPLGVAAVLAFLRRLEARTSVFIVVALLLSLADDRRAAEDLSQYAPGLLTDRTNYAALPIWLIAGGYLLLRAIRVPPRLCWEAAGVLFSALVGWMFVAGSGTREIDDSVWALALVGGLAAAVGGAWGDHVAVVIREPFDRGRVVRMMVVFAVVIPVGVGVIDLAWRVRG